MLSTGHTLSQIKIEWDFPRLERWIEYCEKHPPLQAMIAAYLGVGDARKAGQMRLTEENFESFISMLNAESKLTG